MLRYHIPYIDAPLILYRGEGHYLYLRNFRRFTVFLTGALNFAEDFPGNPRI